MIAFHNDPAIKAKYLDRLASHRAAGNLVKDTEWEEGRGCAIGCTLEAYDHALYEKELGIPQALAQLKDTIFEQLPDSDSQLWPEQFLSAIEPGANLSIVDWKFTGWLMMTHGMRVSKRASWNALSALDLAVWSAKMSGLNAARIAESAAYQKMANKLISLVRAESKQESK